MRLAPLLLLGLLLPGAALAQSGPAGQRCQKGWQTCVRSCFGGDSRTCQAKCDSDRAYCIQNPNARPAGSNPLLRQPPPRTQAR